MMCKPLIFFPKDKHKSPRYSLKKNSVKLMVSKASPLLLEFKFECMAIKWLWIEMEFLNIICIWVFYAVVFRSYRYLYKIVFPIMLKMMPKKNLLKKRNRRIITTEKKQAKPPVSQNKWICRENVKMWMFDCTYTYMWIVWNECMMIFIKGLMMLKRSIWIRKFIWHRRSLIVGRSSSRTHHPKCVKAHAHNTPLTQLHWERNKLTHMC